MANYLNSQIPEPPKPRSSSRGSSKSRPIIGKVLTLKNKELFKTPIFSKPVLKLMKVPKKNEPKLLKLSN